MALTGPVPADKWLRPACWRSHPHFPDVVAAAVYTVTALAVAIIIPKPHGLGFVLSLFAVVASGLALLFRRRAPMISVAATAGIMLLTFSRPASFAAVVTAMALYAVAVFRSARQALLGLLGASASLLVAAVLLPRSMGEISQVVPAMLFS